MIFATSMGFLTLSNRTSNASCLEIPAMPLKGPCCHVVVVRVRHSDDDDDDDDDGGVRREEKETYVAPLILCKIGICDRYRIECVDQFWIRRKAKRKMIWN
jgi:hypothetical protein